jgi:uncharacterized protein DUF6104
MASGVDMLRMARGSEQITFNDVADHLEDFVRTDPDAAQTIDRLGTFLAMVELVEHDHDGDVGSSITS